jgi:excisionase family DNA binding protein
MDHEYLTPGEAAAHLRASPSYLAKLRLTGGGPRFLRVGRSIRYARPDLDTWIARRAAHSTTEYIHRAAGLGPGRRTGRRKRATIEARG